MANQSPDRRQVLEMLARVAAVSQFGGFARWAYAGQAAGGGAKSHSYTPVFFTPAEYAAIDRLSELIIPADETPGAHDAGVAEFIDFMISADPAMQPGFRDGVKPYVDLPEARQLELLTRASQGAGDERKFFNLIREYTVMGYYTSRIGLEQLDYPGLKMYAQSPACPHHDDREHRHLRGAGA